MIKLKFIIPEYLGAQGYVTNYTINNAMDISDLSIKDNMDEPSYITLDGNGLSLIGNSKQFYETGDVVGYISNNVYDDIADVTLELIPDTKGFATNKMLIEFYDGCCKSFTVTADGNSTRYDESNGFINDICVFEINSGTSKVTLSDFEMAANASFLKIASISDGGLFIVNEVKSTSVHEEINILSDDLAINTFEASFIAETNNPIRKGYQLSVYNNNQYFGTFTVTSITREDEFVYSIESENAVGTLDSVRCDGMPALLEINGEPITIKSIDPVQVSLTEILKKATSLTGIYFISDYMPPAGLWSNWFYIFGHIPVDTWRYAICACGWAINMMIDGSRSNKILFKSIPTEITSEILTSDRRIIGKAILEKSELITKAIYMIDQAQCCAEWDDKFQMAIDKCYEIEDAAKQSQKYYFDDAPCVLNNIIRLPLLSEEETDVTITGLTTNCVEFKTTNDIIGIYATPIKIESNPVTIFNEKMSENENEDVNEKIYDQFKCQGRFFAGTTDEEDAWAPINKYNDIKHLIESKGIVKARIILQNEKVGDLIKIETAWDGIVQGIITKMDISFGINNIADIEVTEWNG